jgi:xanthine dehydrogenase YagS FAD-binding subunit
MSRIEWSNATTVGEAIAALDTGAVIKAGGIDLADLMKEHLIAPTRLVNIRKVQGLDRIAEDPKSGDLHVGPLVTLAHLAEEPTVRRRCRALAEAADHAATPHVRNAATLGGNLLQRPRCWYFRSEAFECRRKGGMHCFAIEGENAYHAIFGNASCAIVHPSSAAVALVAHAAKLTIASAKGTREALLESIFVRPETDITREHTLAASELITDVLIPPLPPGGASAYAKLGEKESYDWPIAEVAVVLGRAGGRCTSASIVLGAAAPIPWRAREAEAALVNAPLGEDAARAAATAALRGATPLSQNAYKLPIVETVVRRTILLAMRAEAT